MTLASLKEDAEITAYLERGDSHLGNAGYTEHGLRHARLVADISNNVMRRLNRGEEETRLTAMAGYLHDVGNVINRRDHPTAGGIMALQLLTDRGLSPERAAIIAGAIGNHETEDGKIVSPVSAGLILADKSDVHRSRVRLSEPAEFDIHDRVNYAAEASFLNVQAGTGTITLNLKIDTEISPVMDYFEIFLSRMIMCRRAAVFLGQRFVLEINGMQML
ncbi:MAG: HD domain-containing protein [Bacillota bacterium]